MSLSAPKTTSAATYLGGDPGGEVGHPRRHPPSGFATLGLRLRNGPSGRRFSTRHATRLAKGSVMSWLILILSGALEAVWAAALHRASRLSGRGRIAPA